MQCSRWLTALSLILILVLAACGGDDDSGSNDAASNGDTVSEQAAGSAVAGSAEAAPDDSGDTEDTANTDTESDTSSTTANNAAQPEEEIIIPPVAEAVFAVPYLADYDQIVFSADNSTIALLNEQTAQLQIMDAASGDVLADLSPDPNWIDSNNRTLALSNNGALVSVWNLGRGFNADGIDSGAIYDVATGEIAQAFNYAGAAADVAFDPTGQRYAVLANDTVYIYGLAALDEQAVATLGDSKRTLQWSADGNYVIANRDQSLAIISAAGEIVAEIDNESVEARFANVFISPHEPVFVTTGLNDDTTVFWNTETGAELTRLLPDNPRNMTWELGPGQAIVNEDSGYHVVNISAGTAEFFAPEDVNTFNIDLRADGLLAIGSSPHANFSQVFDYTTNIRLREFNGGVYWFTDAGEWVLVVSNGIVAQHVKYPLTEQQENQFVEEFERFEVLMFDGFFLLDTFYFPETGRLYVFGTDDMLHLYEISPGA